MSIDSLVGGTLAQSPSFPGLQMTPAPARLHACTPPPQRKTGEDCCSTAGGSVDHPLACAACRIRLTLSLSKTQGSILKRPNLLDAKKKCISMRVANRPVAFLHHRCCCYPPQSASRGMLHLPAASIWQGKSIPLGHFRGRRPIDMQIRSSSVIDPGEASQPPGNGKMACILVTMIVAHARHATIKRVFLLWASRNRDPSSIPATTMGPQEQLIFRH